MELIDEEFIAMLLGVVSVFTIVSIIIFLYQEYRDGIK